MSPSWIDRLRTLLLPLVALLAGCVAGNPLGIPKEEWARLSPQQQYSARSKQAELDRQAKAERERAAARAEETRVRAEENRRRELAERRANARYGDIVQCVIEKGIARIGSGLRAVEPAGFSLLRGEEDAVAVASKDGRSGSLRAKYSKNGMIVRLCNDRHCTQFIATAREFHRGIERRLIIDSMLDVRLRCGFAPGAGMFFRGR